MVHHNLIKVIVEETHFSSKSLILFQYMCCQSEHPHFILNFPKNPKIHVPNIPTNSTCKYFLNARYIDNKIHRSEVHSSMSFDDYKDRVTTNPIKIKMQTIPVTQGIHTSTHHSPFQRKPPLGKSLSLPSFRQQFLISISKFVLPVLELYLMEPYNRRSFMFTL